MVVCWESIHKGPNVFHIDIPLLVNINAAECCPGIKLRVPSQFLLQILYLQYPQSYSFFEDAYDPQEFSLDPLRDSVVAIHTHSIIKKYSYGVGS